MDAVTPADLISFFRTQAAAARALGCAQSTIAEWVTEGRVPEGRQYQAQLATKGKLKADKPALRPVPRRAPAKDASHG